MDESISALSQEIFYQRQHYLCKISWSPNESSNEEVSALNQGHNKDSKLKRDLKLVEKNEEP